MASKWGAASIYAAANLAVVVGAAAACSNVLGLGDIREAPCVGADCDAGDSTATGDSPGDDAGATDGAAKEACVPVPVLDPTTLQSSACPPSADGGCSAAPVDAGGLHWVPPHLRPGACASGEIDDYYVSCEGAGATVAACMSYQASNPVCYSCLISHFSDIQYGPIVAQRISSGPYSYSVVNAAGCIVALDPCNEPCARVTLDVVQCTVDACLQSCTTLSEFDNCVTTSEFCGTCGTYELAAHDCAEKLMAAGSPAAPCVTQQGSYLSDLRVAALAICGP
jgi:hypothetical protein